MPDLPQLNATSLAQVRNGELVSELSASLSPDKLSLFRAELAANKPTVQGAASVSMDALPAAPGPAAAAAHTAHTAQASSPGHVEGSHAAASPAPEHGAAGHTAWAHHASPSPVHVMAHHTVPSKGSESSSSAAGMASVGNN